MQYQSNQVPIQQSYIQSVASSQIDHISEEELTVSRLLYLYLMVESNNEKDRLRFGEKKDFYPEIAFDFLKNYEIPKPEYSNNNSSDRNNFFDFTNPPEQIQYNFINKMKNGFISPQKIQLFLQNRGVDFSEKQIVAVFEFFSKEPNQPGLDYESFLKMIIPTSIPQIKMEILKRKVIYETKGLNEKLKLEYQDILFEILQQELNLLNVSEKQKLRLINEFKWDPVRAFGKLDTDQKGFLVYDSVNQAIRKVGKQFVPREYLGLLKRMNKPDGEETITFQDFKDLLSPNLPYFKDDGGVNSSGKLPDLYCSSNKMVEQSQYISKQDISRVFQQNQSMQHTQRSTILQPQNAQKDNLYFVDKQGRIIEQPHPEVQQYIKIQPELSEVINRNQAIQSSQNSNQYQLVPENQYRNDDYTLFQRKNQQYYSNNNPNDLQQRRQQSLNANPQNVQQSQYQSQQLQQSQQQNNPNQNIQQLNQGQQQLNINNPQNNRSLTSQQQQRLNNEQLLRNSQMHRQILFTQKDNLISNNFNEDVKKQASQNFPLFRDIYQAQTFQSTRKDMMLVSPNKNNTNNNSMFVSNNNNNINQQQYSQIFPNHAIQQSQFNSVLPQRQQQQYQQSLPFSSGVPLNNNINNVHPQYVQNQVQDAANNISQQLQSQQLQNRNTIGNSNNYDQQVKSYQNKNSIFGNSNNRAAQGQQRGNQPQQVFQQNQNFSMDPKADRPPNK